jgi:hypothetical protein
MTERKRNEPRQIVAKGSSIDMLFFKAVEGRKDEPKLARV